MLWPQANEHAASILSQATVHVTIRVCLKRQCADANFYSVLRSALCLLPDASASAKKSLGPALLLLCTKYIRTIKADHIGRCTLAVPSLTLRECRLSWSMSARWLSPFPKEGVGCLGTCLPAGNHPCLMWAPTVLEHVRPPVITIFLGIAQCQLWRSLAVAAMAHCTFSVLLMATVP
jgi:hypothetical protein